MKNKLIAVMTAAVAVIPFAVTPAHAGTGGGTIAFECTADLPNFPSDGGAGKCEAGAVVDGGPSVAASAEGTITGRTDGGQPFILVAAGVNNFEATFNYSEGCVAGEPPVAGTAAGSAEISGMTGFVGTTPVTAELTVTFSWTRAGVVAAVTVTGADIDLNGVDDDVTGTVVGAGTAAFVPVLTAGNTCPGGDALKAAVAGSATVTVRG